MTHSSIISPVTSPSNCNLHARKNCLYLSPDGLLRRVVALAQWAGFVPLRQPAAQDLLSTLLEWDFRSCAASSWLLLCCCCLLPAIAPRQPAWRRPSTGARSLSPSWTSNISTPS